MSAADVLELERQAERAYTGLGMSRQFTLDELLAHMEEQREAAIIVKPVEGMTHGELTGLWFSMPGIELILHANTGSALHREQIILHELAHMALGHEKLMDDPGHLAALLPDLAPARIAKVLARCEHGEEHEIVAEALADLFAQAIARSRRGQRAEPLNFGDVFG